MSLNARQISSALLIVASLSASALAKGPHEAASHAHSHAAASHYDGHHHHHRRVGWWPAAYHRGYVVNGRILAYNDRLRAIGETQVLQSQARINHGVAVDQELDNQKKKADNFWALKQKRDAIVKSQSKSAAERKAQQERIAAAHRPKPLVSATWPIALVSGELAEGSRRIDESLRAGQLDEAVHVIQIVKSQLRTQVRSMSPANYTAAKSFLKSLEYEITLQIREGSTPESLASAR